MSLVRLLSGTLREKTSLWLEGKVSKDLPAGSPVVIVGLLDDKDNTYYVCVTANGDTGVIGVDKIKVTITKDLRERLAEATLVDSGGGGR